MIYVRDILIFLLANLGGFFSAPLVYNIAAAAGIFSPSVIETNPQAFNSVFFSGTIMTWLVFAVISLGFFFTEGKIRAVIIALPVIVPTIYGFSVLAGLSPAS